MNLTTRLFTIFCIGLHLANCATYDGIFVGMGTANSIVAAKLVPNFASKRFLILELGGPLEKRNGGTDYPSYYQSEASPLTRFDIPGEYSNIAWNPAGERYKLTQTPGWQGKGFGGNSQFNGMLFQSAPDYVLNQWPSGWQAADLAPYYQQLLSSLTVTNTPSTDGTKYLTSIADAFAAGFEGNSFRNSDTRLLGPIQNLDGFYSTPYVVTDGNGQRGGIVNSFLVNILTASGASSQSNLDIITNAEVQAIVFDSSDPTLAIGVRYSVNGNSVVASLNSNGKVIVGAGALMSPRLMYLSGIGPAGKENTVFAANPVQFVRANSAIGTVYDHAGTQFSVQASGLKRYNYSDYNANADDIENYIISRKGPYSQYGPVSLAHMKSSSASSYPDVELFVSPGSVGGSNPEYNTQDSFQAVLMLLNPTSNDLLKLDGSGNIQFPGIYYSTEADQTTMINALRRTLVDILPKATGLTLNFGPGTSSHPTLSPSSTDDLRSYITSSDNVDGVSYTKMIMNHWCGTIPLVAGSESAGGVDPTSLRVRGTANVHVVDASVFPVIPTSHPVATVMAVALKAADLFTGLFSQSDVVTQNPTTSASNPTTVVPTSATPTSTTTTTAATTQAPTQDTNPATSEATSQTTPATSQATTATGQPTETTQATSTLTTGTGVETSVDTGAETSADTGAGTSAGTGAGTGDASAATTGNQAGQFTNPSAVGSRTTTPGNEGTETTLPDAREQGFSGASAVSPVLALVVTTFALVAL